MSSILIISLRMGYLFSLIVTVAAQVNLNDNGNNTAARVIAGVIVGVVIIVLLAITFGLVYRRRRRAVVTTLPITQPMSTPSQTYTSLPHPSTRHARRQSYLGDNLPQTGFAAAEGQLPVYTPPPPPPPYNRKETSHDMAVEIPEEDSMETTHEPNEDTGSSANINDTIPSGPPPPAHTNANSSRFGWLRGQS
ncbi:uncharacterized protein FIBRA_02637 [Fibroporia radiculosa]|uniref:Mid2 domain-containing protein n=1 Tax=Fibroporia radiculosa TaxID=599839 RepID=J4I961_9APHY|nr:uncharacterized protein FIBRA_02637 [Fibroporia radiculosa]CCM00601.1 predicted protein [Fibroporia radiculosa]